MRDDGSIAKEDRLVSSDHVGLAIQVIERLAMRRTGGVAVLKQALINRLVKTALAKGDVSFVSLLDDFRTARVPPEEVADDYIPAVARFLGEEWLADRLGFADVTIGSNRLQGLLHALQSDWAERSSRSGRDSAVLLIVPPNEQHTLGAMVTASRLRREGVSVAIRFAPGMNDLTALLENRHFDAVLITVGSSDRVEICLKLVKTLKQMSKGSLNVAVGGGCVQAYRVLLTEAGADLVTSDVSELISEFRL